MSEQFNPCEFCGARECVDNKCKLKNITKQLKAENEKLKYKLSDTEHRLVELSKANTHNLVLLQRRNKCLDEIEKCVECSNCKFNEYDDYNDCSPVKCNEICKLIKQAKEGE